VCHILSERGESRVECDHAGACRGIIEADRDRLHDEFVKKLACVVAGGRSGPRPQATPILSRRYSSRLHVKSLHEEASCQALLWVGSREP